MNKHSYSLCAIAALSAFATAAYGQSSVTLYGIIDAGFAISRTPPVGVFSR